MIAILIPARFASTRFPGKPLVHLRGVTGTSKSLIERSWEAGRAVPEADAVYVATDDDRIAETCRDFGADVIMTSEACANGTERCADAVVKAALKADIVINLQGDALLTPPWFLSALIEAMLEDPTVDVATPVLRCDPMTLAMFLEDRKAGRVGGTTAVFDQDRRALYFSKEVIPYTSGRSFEDGAVPVFHHVGVYAYRPDALLSYGNWPVGPLEEQEGLEQLRFLEQGRRVQCVEVDAGGRVFWEVNNPEDVDRIEAVLRKEKIV